MAYIQNNSKFSIPFNINLFSEELAESENEQSQAGDENAPPLSRTSSMSSKKGDVTATPSSMPRPGSGTGSKAAPATPATSLQQGKGGRRQLVVHKLWKRLEQY